MTQNSRFNNNELSNKLKAYFKNNIKIFLKTENKVFINTKNDIFYEINIYDANI
jgi:hypothetical protein